MARPFYKVVLVGNAGVGKSNIYERYVNDRYDPNHAPTIGSDFSVTKLEFGDDDAVNIHLWDTAGQERFNAITNRIYLKGADGVCLTYDVTKRQSFERVDFWRQLVESCESLGPNVVYILVGNKSDLQEQRAVSSEEGLRQADKYSMLFTETSAKTGENITQAFHMLIAEVHRKHNEVDDYWENWQHRNSILIDSTPQEIHHSSCC